MDKHLENSVNMVFSIYHCIKSILPEESAQVCAAVYQRCAGLLPFNGNTHVTCHVGVPSCGQRQRNVFTT
jgi:hypothetical protein